MNHAQTKWIVLLLLGGCAREPPAPVQDSGGASMQGSRPASVQGSRPAPLASRAPAESAIQVLDSLDPRAPVPLLPVMAHHQKQNMLDHLVAVQEIIGALATNDFAAVEKAAARLGFSDAMAQTCTHMGAGAAGFAEQALRFHHTADGIAAAAKQRKAAPVLEELSATLRACNACHASWKQRVVDEVTWREVSPAAAPHHSR